MKQKILYAITVFIFTTLFFRLLDIQLLNGKTYRSLALGNKSYRVELPAKRGVFLDRYNNPLVFNKPVYYKLDSDASLYSKQTRITPDEALVVASKNADLLRIKTQREYLFPQATAHVLGYVGSVSLDDLNGDSSLGISDKIGKFGLEKRLQDFLRGGKSYQIFEINALGEKQRLLAQENGVAGKNIVTTIDPYLSKVSFEAMGDNKGAVVILDVKTGEVLSLVSTPTFDASVLSESFLDEDKERERVLKVREFFSNPQKLFFNRAVSGLYPPGSVFKLITALAGLEGSKITQETSVLDDGVLKVGDYSYANWYFTQFGRKEGEISLLRAIARSNDIYFYKVAEWVGPEKLKEMAQSFGLGVKTDIQLQAEAKGVIPDPDWKQEIIGERWFLGNTYHMGIGQGDILVTPIQMAQLVQAVANNGRLCSPTLLTNANSFIEQNNCREAGVLEENINLLLEGMLQACSSGGTGFPFFGTNADIFNDRENGQLSAKDWIKDGAVACKTGTSEFGGVDENGYRKTHAWFASIVGTANLLEKNSDLLVDGDKKKWLQDVKEHGFPEEIVMVVLVESDEVNPYKEGSRDAGKVAKQIYDWMFKNEI